VSQDGRCLSVINECAYVIIAALVHLLWVVVMASAGVKCSCVPLFF
jgi:hypothetical protein